MNLRIHPKYRSGGILENLILRSGKNYIRNYINKFLEMIRSLQLLIQIDILLIRGGKRRLDVHDAMMIAFLISSLHMTISGRWAVEINEKSFSIPGRRRFFIVLPIFCQPSFEVVDLWFTSLTSPSFQHFPYLGLALGFSVQTQSAM